MVEIRNAIPYLAGLEWTLNKLNQTVPVRNAYGAEGFASQAIEPQLVVTILTYVAGDQLAPKVYTFAGDKYAELKPALQPVLDQWQIAFDKMLNEFSLTRDQSAQEKALGLPYYLRLDRWKVNITPGAAASVQAVVGVYETYNAETGEYANPVSYKVLTSIDGNTIRQRQSDKANLQDAVNRLQEIVDGAADMSIYVDPDAVLKGAQVELPQRKKQLADFDLQEGSLAPLKNMLDDEAVQQSIKLLCNVLFTKLKEIDSQWANIDVIGLLDPSIFKLPDVS